MAIYFIEETAGEGAVKRAFYNTDLVDYAAIPSGAVEVSSEDYEALMAGQAAGGTIIASSDGYPILIPTTGETSTRCHFIKTSIDEASITKITDLSYVLSPSGAVIETDQTQDLRTKIEIDDTMVDLYAYAVGDEAGVHVDGSNARMYARTDSYNEASANALSNEVYVTINEKNGELKASGTVSFSTTGLSDNNPHPFNFSPSKTDDIDLGRASARWRELHVGSVYTDIVLSNSENTGQLQATTAYIETLHVGLTDVKSMFGASLASTDNKRITLRSSDSTGLSNFDPASIIANVLQGKGYGSTTVFGKVGSIGLFWYIASGDISYEPGTIIAGTSLNYACFNAVAGTTSSSTAQIPGSWAILNLISSDVSSGMLLVLAVRVA